MPARTPGRRGSAAIALTLLVVLCVACDREERAEPPRGILLVTVDGLVPRDLEPFGGPIELPTLGALVADGRGWSDGWTASPMTRPAAASYLTGLAPDRHRVLDDRHDVLDPLLETLPGALGRAGFRTAAFLDNSALGRSSGLLESFEVVDDPLPPQYVERRWVPAMRPAEQLSRGLEAWLATLDEQEPFFAWVHLSRPLRAQMTATAEAAGRALEAFDRTLAELVRSADAAAGGEAEIVVAGTLGLVAGTPTTAPGPGISVSQEALTVPIVWRGRAFDSSWRPDDAFVWAPDVTATIAEVAGIDRVGEGRALSAAAGQRDAVAYARAAYDQLGWLPSAAARRGALRVEIGLREGALTLDGSAPDDDQILALHRLLTETRPIPLPRPVDAARAESALVAAGLELQAVAAEGRRPPEEPAQRAALDALWRARRAVLLGNPQEGLQALGATLEHDPLALSPLIDRGFILYNFFDRGEGLALSHRAVASYPTSAEVLRWHAATVLDEELELAGELLELVADARPTDADVRYDLACVAARLGDEAEAERRLRVAIEAGFREFDLMAQDADLRSLRESGALGRVLREFR